MLSQKTCKMAVLATVGALAVGGSQAALPASAPGGPEGAQARLTGRDRALGAPAFSARVGGMM